LRYLVALLLALVVPSAALAQEPVKQREFVYGLNVFDGITYQSGFVPAAVGELYVVAGADSVVDPKVTDVYFWPITNEYRPDFVSLNELVPGKLEVSQAGRLVGALDLTPYVVQFDQTGQDPNGRLYTGDAAQAAWARFQAERASYIQRLREYTEANLAFNEKLDEIRKAGGGTPPEPPREPVPLTLYSTEPAQGFRINLPAGEYLIQVRDGSGQVVPGSAKRLAAIAPRRQGVGYEVVPQEKWTFPERADDPADAIYTVPSGVVYLRPFQQLEFNALEYARLRNPQDIQATANRWTWVHTAALTDAQMLVRGSGTEQRLPLAEFKVEQVPGAALGYRVVPFDRGAGGSADLVAYRLEAPTGRGGLATALLAADGREVAGSARELKVSAAVPDWQLGLPVLVPLAVGLTVGLSRRERVRSIRSLTPEQRQLVA
jgi:hypothetical protein